MKQKTILEKKINAILAASASAYSSTIAQMRCSCRTRNHAYARALAMFMLNSNEREFGLGLTMEEASRVLRKKSHSSVYYAVRLINSLSLEPAEKYKIDMAKLVVSREFEKINTEELTKEKINVS